MIVKRLAPLALLLALTPFLAACPGQPSDPNDTRAPLQKCLEDKSGLGC